MAITEENYSVLGVYETGEYVFSVTDVARAVAEARSNHNRWAVLRHQDVHKVISWHSDHGDSVRMMDVFFSWENGDDNFDLNTYQDGLNDDGNFDADLAVERLVDNQIVKDEDAKAALREINEREERIVNVGKHWLCEYEGKEIPHLPPITSKLMSRDEMKVHSSDCVNGFWPEYLVWMGFHRPNPITGLIPVNHRIRPRSAPVFLSHTHIYWFVGAGAATS